MTILILVKFYVCLLDKFLSWFLASSNELITDTQLHMLPLQWQEGNIMVHKGMLDQLTLM